MKPDPLAFYCPQCHVEPGHNCKNWRGSGCAPHGKRIDRAKRSAAGEGEPAEAEHLDEPPAGDLFDLAGDQAEPERLDWSAEAAIVHAKHAARDEWLQHEPCECGACNRARLDGAG